MIAPAPAPAKKVERSMEIRLNSVDDAKSVVQHIQSIAETFREGKFDSIEFVMAEELRPEIMEIIAGMPRVRKFYKTVTPLRPTNTLYVLPHFQPPAVRVPIPTARVADVDTQAPLEPARQTARKGARA